MKKSMWLLLFLLAACRREILVQKQSMIAPPPKPRPPAVSYYEGAHAAEAIQKIRARVGEPFRVLRISIDGDDMSVQVQDPTKRENVDEYRCDHGEVRAPTPVRLFGDTDQQTLEANVFDPADLDLTKIGDLLREGNDKIQLEGRELSGISIERDMFDDDRPIMIDVNYRGIRKNGYLRADRHGAHPKVNIF
jgi:hypothetical protein